MGREREKSRFFIVLFVIFKICIIYRILHYNKNGVFWCFMCISSSDLFTSSRELVYHFWDIR